MATTSLSRAPAAPTERPRARVARSTLTCFLVALSICGVVAWHDRGLIGDEPHYLMVARSIIHDHDVDLAGDYTTERTGDLAPTLSSAAHAFEYRDDGRLRPIQGVGFPMLLAPALAVADKPGAARLLMAVLAALTAALIWGLLRDLAAVPRTARIVVWLAVTATLPFIGYVDQIYPEVPAALAVVVAVRLLIRPATVARIAGASAAAAFLLLLHARFGVLALGIAVAALWRACRVEASEPSPPPARGRALVGAAVLPIGLGFATVVVLARHLYGAWWPTGAYRRDTIRHTIDLGNLYPWGVGRLLDPEIGVLPFAPVYLVALIGLPLVVLRWPRAGALAVGAATVYAATIALNARISVGPTMGARVLVVLVPVAAVPIALALGDRVVVTGITVALLAVSVVQAARTVVGPERAYADFVTAGSPVLLPGLWPETVQPRGVQARSLRLDRQPRQTGQVVGQGFDAHVEARSGRDEPGYLQFARAVVLDAGVATVTVRVTTPSSAPPGTEVVSVDLLRDRRDVIARRSVVAAGPSSPRSHTTVFRFAAPGGALFEPRVYWPGSTDVRLESVRFAVDGAATGPAPDWLQALGWGLVVVAGATWLARDEMRLRNQDAPRTGAAPRNPRRSTSSAVRNR
jgi:hypothetical protein